MAHVLSVAGTPRLRMETGYGDDRSEHTRLRYGLIHIDSAFRFNRPIAPGGYIHSVAAIDLHPNISGEFLEPGVGIRNSVVIAQLWRVRA